MQTSEPQKIATSGFSIVELLVSLAIASIAFVYLIDILPVTSKSTAKNGATAAVYRDIISISTAFDRHIAANPQSNSVKIAGASAEGFMIETSAQLERISWEPRENFSVLTIGQTEIQLHTKTLYFEFLVRHNDASVEWSSDPAFGDIKAIKTVFGGLADQIHVLAWDSGFKVIEQGT